MTGPPNGSAPDDRALFGARQPRRVGGLNLESCVERIKDDLFVEIEQVISHNSRHNGRATKGHESYQVLVSISDGAGQEKRVPLTVWWEQHQILSNVGWDVSEWFLARPSQPITLDKPIPVTFRLFDGTTWRLVDAEYAHDWSKGIHAPAWLLQVGDTVKKDRQKLRIERVLPTDHDARNFDVWGVETGEYDTRFSPDFKKWLVLSGPTMTYAKAHQDELKHHLNGWYLETEKEAVGV